MQPLYLRDKCSHTREPGHHCNKLVCVQYHYLQVCTLYVKIGDYEVFHLFISRAFMSELLAVVLVEVTTRSFSLLKSGAGFGQ